MNEEKIKELLDFLKSLGFEGDRLEQDIKKKMQLNVPGFDAKHSINHGEEQMRFDLQFRLDTQFNSYRLIKYTATHRDPLLIKHKIINGIDTAQLEERMKSLNWDIYFDSMKGDSELSFKDHYAETISQLNRLSEYQDFNGIKIQEELMFKYWPQEVYNLSAGENLKPIYENSRDFSSTEWGVCNTHLAFHILSGRFDDILEKMSALNLDEFPGADVYTKLEKFLSDNPGQFEFKCSRNEPEGLIEYIIPVSKIDDWYSVDTYKAVLRPYPPIEHGTYNGIDTQVLENQMRKIDWHNDNELFIFHEDSEPEFKPKVGDVQEQIFRLSLDLTGADIADKLQAKYWSNATFFEDTLQQSAWDYLESLSKRTQEFPVELEAKSAFNLLCGRAILKDKIHPLVPEKPAWARFDLTTVNANGGYLTEIMLGFDRNDLEATLKNFPIPPRIIAQTTDFLARGDISLVTLLNGQNIFLEANPEQKSVNVYSIDMRPIQVNIHFDPGWKPVNQPELKPENQERKSRQNFLQPDDPPDKGNTFRRRR